MGTLYVVATPIGNLGDITLRAIEVLGQCDRVVCEDTRVTGRLLSKYEIKKPMLSFNEFNEEERVFDVLEILGRGENVALVSDSGTPLVSDPGYKLVSLARAKGIPVVPIPGSSAVVAALSAAGLPTNNFLFLGFLPKKSGKKARALENLSEALMVLSGANSFPTVVLYESAQRITDTLLQIEKSFNDPTVVVAREITKMHEEFLRGTASSLAVKFADETPKGEICILFNTKTRGGIKRVV